MCCHTECSKCCLVCHLSFLMWPLSFNLWPLFHWWRSSLAMVLLEASGSSLGWAWAQWEMWSCSGLNHSGCTQLGSNYHCPSIVIHSCSLCSSSWGSLMVTCSVLFVSGTLSSHFWWIGPWPSLQLTLTHSRLWLWIGTFSWAFVGLLCLHLVLL